MNRLRDKKDSTGALVTTRFKVVFLIGVILICVIIPTIAVHPFATAFTFVEVRLGFLHRFSEGIVVRLLPARRQLAAREISSVELTRSYLERIERLNGTLNAFITTDPEKSLAQARAADERIARGEAAAMTGIPVAHKDLFCAKGWLTTCGSSRARPFPAHSIVAVNSSAGRARSSSSPSDSSRSP